MAAYIYLPHVTWSPLWFGVAFVLWLAFCRCAAMTHQELDKAINKAIAEAMFAHQIKVPDATEVIGIDHSQFTKALRGEAYRNITLSHMVRLGIRHPKFFVTLCANLTWLVVQQNGLAVVENGQAIGRDILAAVGNLTRRA
jgi:hypothetical protein